MRILITSDIFPPDVGGPATYVPRIAAELTRRGHQVTVLTYSLVPSYAADGSHPFPVVRVSAAPPRWRRFPRTLSAILRCGRQVDVVYVNGLVTESVLANYVLRKPMVAKVVGDLAWERSRDKGWIHDDIDPFQVERYALKVELMRWRRTVSYQRVPAIIVPSDYLRRMLVEHWRLPASGVHVVYNSFEPRPRRGGTEHQASSGQGLPPTAIDLPVKYKLVTVCRLTSWKGVDGLIRALPALGSDVGLAIVGDGPLYAELNALARDLGVDKRVLFAGMVLEEHVSAYLGASDIFVLNSTYEGMPHVILEAMAAGLPVVATAAGGSGEIVEDGKNGLLVPPGDGQALLKALRRMLSDPAEREQLARRGQDTLRRFSLERMVQQTEDVLRQAASHVRAPSSGKAQSA